MDVVIPRLARPQLAAEDISLAIDDGEDLRRALQDLGLEELLPFGGDGGHCWRLFCSVVYMYQSIR